MSKLSEADLGDDYSSSLKKKNKQTFRSTASHFDPSPYNKPPLSLE